MLAGWSGWENTMAPPGARNEAMSSRQARGETVCSITSKQVIRLNFFSGRAGLENGS
jgi:hypothetical protein